MEDFLTRAKYDFERARFKAFWNGVLGHLLKRPNDLLSFEALKSKIDLGPSRDAGVQPVEIAKIVGSVDRYRDFDGRFLPTQRFTEGRWEAIDQAHLAQRELPPVKLYQVGDVYFVVDGNHRVSVARERGGEFIDAEVMRFHPKVPVGKIDPRKLELMAQYDHFLSQTGLHRLRPGGVIEVTLPGGYERLLEQVRGHHYFLGLDCRCPVTWEQAVVSWYDNHYRQVVAA
ncbi:MAG: transcriptional regulator, partial [Deinococcus sp.]|nr:transcriptional regulator [Deinococcus sp.]